jgi:mannose-6-phosphate isomerase-like protein (cupin superfamily)
MEYVRKVDMAAFDSSGPDERVNQRVLDPESGSKTCVISVIKTPPGGGSPRGLHTHPVDQIYYIMSGNMQVEVEGKEYSCGPGTLVVFPAGTPHRNWVTGDEPTLHIAFNTPLPDPNAASSQPVQA